MKEKQEAWDNNIWDSLKLSSKLPSYMKKKAKKSRENFCAIQSGKIRDISEYEWNSELLSHVYLNTWDKVHEFLKKVQEKIDQGKPMICIFDIQQALFDGPWIKWRKYIDKNQFYDEGVGFRASVVQMMLSEDLVGVIPLRQLNFSYAREKGVHPEPWAPPELTAILTNKNILKINCGVVQDCLTYANLFEKGPIDGIPYIDLDNLVTRTLSLREEGPSQHCFVDQQTSLGLLKSYHCIFPGHTFFKNCYMTVSDWNGDLSEEQKIYCWSNLDRAYKITMQCLKELSDIGLSPRTQISVLPRRVNSKRIDYDYLEWKYGKREKPHWAIDGWVPYLPEHSNSNNSVPDPIGLSEPNWIRHLQNKKNPNKLAKSGIKIPHSILGQKRKFESSYDEENKKAKLDTNDINDLSGNEESKDAKKLDTNESNQEKLDSNESNLEENPLLQTDAQDDLTSQKSDINVLNANNLESSKEYPEDSLKADDKISAPNESSCLPNDQGITSRYDDSSRKNGLKKFDESGNSDKTKVKSLHDHPEVNDFECKSRTYTSRPDVNRSSQSTVKIIKEIVID